MKNADAQNVAKQLKDLVAEQDSSSGGRFWYGGFSQSSGKGLKKANFVADRRRNTIVVQGPPAAMEGIAKMISELDLPVTDDALAPRIYPLKYVNASDIEDVLNELFLKKVQQQRPYWWDDNSEPQTDKDVGRLYGKVRTSPASRASNADRRHIELWRRTCRRWRTCSSNWTRHPKPARAHSGSDCGSRTRPLSQTASTFFSPRAVLRRCGR